MRLKSGSLLLAAASALSALVALPLFSHPATVSADDLVDRGRYLTMAGGCMECHTERVGNSPFELDQKMLYAGGEEFNLPIGTVHSANITSDRATGIGNATDAQIKRAIREGIGIDGRKLLVMPWENIRAYSDEDLNAIVAFLRTVPAVNYKVAAATVAAPARDGWYDDVAKRAVPMGGATAPGGTNNPARGRYLMTTFGCLDCHGPNMAAGFPPFFAANITNDVATGLGRWNNEQIVRAVREAIRPSGIMIPPPMPTLSAYKYMNDDDIYNIISYIRSAPTVSRQAGPPAGSGAPAAPPAAPPAALPRTGDDSLPGGLLAGLVGLGVMALGLGFRFRRARARS